MDQAAANLRESILGLLHILSSAQEQLEYEENVPGVVPTELICMWFDDLYHPASGIMQGFTPEESIALTEFDRYYSTHKDRLPNANGTIMTWLADHTWQGIMKEAQLALDRIATK
jgi:hypothetical protein